MHVGWKGLEDFGRALIALNKGASAISLKTDASLTAVNKGFIVISLKILVHH